MKRFCHGQSLLPNRADTKSILLCPFVQLHLLSTHPTLSTHSLYFLSIHSTLFTHSLNLLSISSKCWWGNKAYIMKRGLWPTLDISKLAVHFFAPLDCCGQDKAIVHMTQVAWARLVLSPPHFICHSSNCLLPTSATYYTPTFIFGTHQAITAAYSQVTSRGHHVLDDLSLDFLGFQGEFLT